MTASPYQNANYPNRKQRLLANIPSIPPFQSRPILNPCMSREDEVITISDEETDDPSPLLNPSHHQQQTYHPLVGHTQPQHFQPPVQQVHPTIQNFQAPRHYQLERLSRDAHLLERPSVHQFIKPFQPPRHYPHQQLKASQAPRQGLYSLGQELSQPRPSIYPTMNKDHSRGHGIPQPRQTFPLPRQISLAKRQSFESYCQDIPSTTTSQPPTTCKVVRKLSDNTWIELDVSCAGESLDQVSKTIQRFVASYNPASVDPKDTHRQCHCRHEGSGTPSKSIAEVAIPPDQHEPTSVVQSDLYPVSFKDDVVLPYCSVCQAPAESSHLNYGAHSCFSCRAFFRRSVQMEIYPNFNCTLGGQCALTPGNRSECRKCRFDKCLKEGMKISAVLNRAQKRTRFRRLLGLKQMEQVNKSMRMKLDLRKFRKKTTNT